MSQGKNNRLSFILTSFIIRLYLSIKHNGPCARNTPGNFIFVQKPPIKAPLSICSFGGVNYFNVYISFNFMFFFRTGGPLNPTLGF